MIQIIIRILKQKNFGKSLIFETPFTGKYMFCLHYIPHPPVVGYGSKNVKIMVFWNMMWSNFRSNGILEDLAAFICCLFFPADGGSRFSLKYCLLSIKLINIKVEIPVQSRAISPTVWTIPSPHRTHGIPQSLRHCSTSRKHILSKQPPLPHPILYKPLRSTAQDFIAQTTCSPR